MSLEISNLTKKFGEQTALNNINIEIKKNEIIGLLGPNGAGKSTLMKSVVGVIKIDEGKIIFDGKDITENEVFSKKNIGFLPENNPLYQEMYVKEYLQFVANIHGISNEKVEEIINLVGITPEKNKKISQLSKGYKQRVGIAQALLHNPEILILDEPTSGLDPNQLADIRQLIRYLGKEKTIILSTHIMQEVTSVCNQVVIINQGKIVANNSVSELQKQVNPLTKIIVKFEQAIPLEVIENCNAVKSAVAEENNTLFKIESEDTLQTKKSIFDT